MELTTLLIEVIGWTADILFISAFYLVSSKKLKGDGRLFNFMNLGGAVLFGTYAVIKNILPVLILEIFWGGFAILALYKTFRPKPTTQEGNV